MYAVQADGAKCELHFTRSEQCLLRAMSPVPTAHGVKRAAYGGSITVCGDWLFAE